MMKTKRNRAVKFGSLLLAVVFTELFSGIISGFIMESRDNIGNPWIILSEAAEYEQTGQEPFSD